jgi:hypothetical protein
MSLWPAARLRHGSPLPVNGHRGGWTPNGAAPEQLGGHFYWTDRPGQTPNSPPRLVECCRPDARSATERTEGAAPWASASPPFRTAPRRDNEGRDSGLTLLVEIGGADHHQEPDDPGQEHTQRDRDGYDDTPPGARGHRLCRRQLWAWEPSPSWAWITIRWCASPGSVAGSTWTVTPAAWGT